MSQLLFGFDGLYKINAIPTLLLSLGLLGIIGILLTLGRRLDSAMKLERFGIPREFREMPQQKREAISYGSGFILKDNYIMTNFHVVEDSTDVTVSLSDRRDKTDIVDRLDVIS